MKGFKFLITGAGRGGTSLLAGLLAAHPKLEVGFESFAPELIGTHPQAGRSVPERLHRFRAACDLEAARHPTPWGNKITTEQIAGLEEVNNAGLDVAAEFYASLADIRHIFILRDGRTCVRSKVTRTGQPIDIACQRWLFSVEIFRRFQNSSIPGVVIRFEDLVRDPRTAIAPVCEFLGVNFDEAMLAGTQHPQMRPEYRQTKLDPSKALASPLPDDAMALIEPALRECGYVAA